MDRDDMWQAEDQEPGTTRTLTSEGWEDAPYVEPDDSWRLLDDGSWLSPDEQTRSWRLAGPEPGGL